MARYKSQDRNSLLLPVVLSEQILPDSFAFALDYLEKLGVRLPLNQHAINKIAAYLRIYWLNAILRRHRVRTRIGFSISFLGWRIVVGR